MYRIARTPVHNTTGTFTDRGSVASKQMTTLSPSSISRLYQPSSCELRTWLRSHGFEESPPGEFDEFIFAQGLLHEQRVLEELRASHPDLIDLDGFNNKNAEAETIAALEDGGHLIYQGMFVVKTELGGNQVTVLGYPDFLIPDGDGWIISDAKLTRSIFNKPRKDGTRTPKSTKIQIVLQLQLYGWMLAQIIPGAKFTLQVNTGSGETEAVEYDGGEAALSALERVLEIEALPEEPAEEVGWSKCSGCGFREHCWPRAEERQAIGIVIDVNVKLAAKLTEAGVTSYSDLYESHNEESLAELKSPGKGDDPAQQAAARLILENAEALSTGLPVRRRQADGAPFPIPAELSADDNYVMFDLEGAPPEGSTEQIVYIWGAQVFGKNGGKFEAAIAGFDPGGDEQGWRDFLELAAAMIAEHPGIRFVHWANYEKDMVTKYLERFGDDAADTGATVLASLLNLLPIAEKIVAVPLPSYSLKVVEKLIAFERKAVEVGKGDDSIVAYTTARDSNDAAVQAEIIESIRAYNEEDLAATWAVQEWLVGLGSVR